MTAQARKTRSDTAERILDLAETLIQTRGYSAISYQDLSDGLGIRKASIHYHFPSKTDLGVAVVRRYRERFGSMLDAAAGDESIASADLLDRYMAPYLDYAQTPDRVCLCGALAGEILALPPELRAEVDAFFEQHQAWLTGILARGSERGEFTLSDAPERVARMLFGALQGALLVKRTTGDAKQLQDVVDVLKHQLHCAETSSARSDNARR